jgi:hypothetical protein
MMKHLKVLLSVLLVALAGGCGDKEDVLCCIRESPRMVVSFIDSEGRDLVEGIPDMRLEPLGDYNGGFLPRNTTLVRLFINGKEILSPKINMSTVHKAEDAGELYEGIHFGFVDLMDGDPNVTVRLDFVCQHLFGTEVHTLTIEVTGYYLFSKCLFDGVEALPVSEIHTTYRSNAYLVRVDR